MAGAAAEAGAPASVVFHIIHYRIEPKCVSRHRSWPNGRIVRHTFGRCGGEDGRLSRAIQRNGRGGAANDAATTETRAPASAAGSARVPVSETANRTGGRGACWRTLRSEGRRAGDEFLTHGQASTLCLTDAGGAGREII